MNNEECAHELEMLRPYQHHAPVDEALELAVRVLRAANSSNSSNSSPASGAAAMREAAAKVADDYDCLYADGRGAAVAECQEAIAAAIRALPAPEPECHGCKHWTVDPLAKDYDKPNQYGRCRGMRACGVEIETTGDCSVDAIGTDATFCCKGWEAR